MISRQARAEWRGGITDGSGRLTAGRVDSAYSHASRFENGDGTSPEALIGAAHAGCFSMALSLFLGKHGYTPTEIRTVATVRFDPVELEVVGVDLETEASVPGLTDPAEFQRIADAAKEGCPISRALRALEIRLVSVRLENI